MRRQPGRCSRSLPRTSHPETASSTNAFPSTLFYERLGFVRLEPLPVPRGCPLLVPMRREPR